jgi:hypothetical protein
MLDSEQVAPDDIVLSIQPLALIDRRAPVIERMTQIEKTLSEEGKKIVDEIEI